MMKCKVLFLIHDLGQGGAEKVLVNLVNNMNQLKFDITVMSLFGGGVNEQFLKPNIQYRTVFKRMIPGNSRLMKLLSPKQLHNLFIMEKYDIEISYLEGPSARIISGCDKSNTKLINWVHSEQRTRRGAALSFRSMKEAEKCYRKFHQHVFVADTVRQDFLRLFPQRTPCCVLCNTVEFDMIQYQSNEQVPEFIEDGCKKIVAAGSLKEVKGFDRLLRIIQRLKKEKYLVHLYLLGKGPLREELEEFTKMNGLTDQVTFLGYQTNPYKYVAKCDLFVCSSHSEGFSTAATEALIVGTPVCTVDVSGMREMLGEHNEYGIITDNNEEALYRGIKRFLDDSALRDYYRKQALVRGRMFSTQNTVKAVEDMLLSL